MKIRKDYLINVLNFNQHSLNFFQPSEMKEKDFLRTCAREYYNYNIKRNINYNIKI